MGKEGGRMKGEPEETEGTIYDLVSWDLLSEVADTGVCLHISLPLMKNRQLNQQLKSERNFKKRKKEKKTLLKDE